MPLENILLKYMAVIAIVAIFSWFVSQADPTGPQLVGWNNIQNMFSNPLSGFNAFQGNWANQHECSGWDVGCWLGNIAQLFVGIATNIVAVATWFFAAIFNMGAGLFGVLTLTFYPPLPTMVQVLLWVFIAPFWFLTAIFIFGMVRGAGK